MGIRPVWTPCSQAEIERGGTVRAWEAADL